MRKSRDTLRYSHAVTCTYEPINTNCCDPWTRGTNIPRLSIAQMQFTNDIYEWTVNKPERHAPAVCSHIISCLEPSDKSISWFHTLDHVICRSSINRVRLRIFWFVTDCCYPKSHNSGQVIYFHCSLWNNRFLGQSALSILSWEAKKNRINQKHLLSYRFTDGQLIQFPRSLPLVLTNSDENKQIRQAKSLFDNRKQIVYAGFRRPVFTGQSFW